MIINFNILFVDHNVNYWITSNCVIQLSFLSLFFLFRDNETNSLKFNTTRLRIPNQLAIDNRGRTIEYKRVFESALFSQLEPNFFSKSNTLEFDSKYLTLMLLDDMSMITDILKVHMNCKNVINL